jgi:hypothetical protein
MQAAVNGAWLPARQEGRAEEQSSKRANEQTSRQAKTHFIFL